MPDKSFRQTENTRGPFIRYGILAIYVLLGAHTLSLELSRPVHDWFSVLRGLSLSIMLVLVHLACWFSFGPRLQIIVRVAVILALVAALAVMIDGFWHLSDSPDE